MVKEWWIWRGMPAQTRGQLLALGVCFFSLLFGYPFIRSLSTAFFLESQGARQSPLVWLLTVLVLGLCVVVMNTLHTRLGQRKIFGLIGGVSLLALLSFYQLYSWQDVFAFPLYIAKEVYIVLLVHLAIGRLNTLLEVDQAKRLYGPFGAIGSLGGLLGGLGTHYLAEYASSLSLLLLTLLSLVTASLAFSFTGELSVPNRPTAKPAKRPLKALGPVRLYVGLIIALVCLSQFIVNIANFKFNLLFEVLVEGVNQKASALGLIFSLVNGLSLFFQVFLVPVLLARSRLRSVHTLIPLSYVLAYGAGFLIWGHLLWGVAFGFILIKTLDYSIFAPAKEILYFPLSVEQKYGAKYLVDMVFYRFAKGLISFLLIFIQGHTGLNLLMLGCLALWLGLLISLFRQRDHLLKETS